jgi:uncharacterized membrane protein YfcA
MTDMPWIALPLGTLTGLVMGALGGGGAILTIPVLIYVLGQSPHEATTSSLVIVGLSALAATVGHLRAGRVRVADAAILAVVGSLGTYAGSAASAAVDQRVLLVLLASLLAVVAALMLRPSPPGIGSENAVPTTGGASHWLRMSALAIGLGALTGFFGVGGGFAIVPALTLVLGYPMTTAVGTSLLVITLNSATAFVSRLGQGVQLDGPLLVTFTAGAILGSVIGGYAGRRTSPALLKRGFAALLFVVAAYMLVSAVLGR